MQDLGYTRPCRLPPHKPGCWAGASEDFRRTEQQSLTLGLRCTGQWLGGAVGHGDLQHRLHGDTRPTKGALKLADPGARRRKAGPPSPHPCNRRLPSAPHRAPPASPRHAHTHQQASAVPCVFPHRPLAAAGSHRLQTASLQSQSTMHTHHCGLTTAASPSPRWMARHPPDAGQTDAAGLSDSLYRKRPSLRRIPRSWTSETQSEGPPPPPCLNV